MRAPGLCFLPLLHLLLLLLAFATAKQSKVSLRPKVRPVVKEQATQVSQEFEGLPGEVEYDIDLTDQRKSNLGGQEQPAEASWWVVRLLQSIQNLGMTEDLADRLDDLICAWDKVVGTDFETLVLLLLGWLAFGAVVFLLSHLIYSSLGAGEELAPPPAIPPFKPHLDQTRLPKISVNNNLTSPDDVAALSHPKRPVALGSDSDVVDYINKCWDVVYSNKKAYAEIFRLWLEKLNDFTKRSALDDGLLLEFLELTPDSSVPTFSNMTAESLPSDNISVSSDVNASFALKIKTSRPIQDRLEINYFTLVVDKLRGRFSLTVIQSERLLIAKLEGWPDLRTRLIPDDFTQAAPTKREEQNLHELIQDIASSAIRGVQLDIRRDDLAGFPVFCRSTNSSKPAQNGKLSLSSRAFGGSKPHSQTRTNNYDKGDPSLRLLDVKVVKAVQLGGQTGNCLEPYVVIEVDDPSQRHQTRPGTGPQTQWDETFTIDISRQSSEILFEVWDQGQKIGKSDTFMGLGIVSVSELMVTASQRHVIPLQGRPYEEDQVTGMLTIEFLFKDGGLTFSEADVMSGVHRTLEMRQSKTAGGGMQYNKKTTYSLYEPHIPDLLNGADVAGIVLKELEAKAKERNGSQPTKSTLLIHAVQRPTRDQPRGSETGQSPETTESIGDASIASRDSGSMVRRGRDKKRNLVSTIKKRFSGTRSLSSNKQEVGGAPVPQPRVHSLDRVRSASEHRPESLSSTNSFLTIPGLQSEDASSMSDVSGISTASNKTYVTEDSSLVLETLEDGRHHHYLIPSQVAKRGRFKKKGTKLHIFLDHIFVARHIKLGTTCQACEALIPLRLGKQAYVCRDCGITTHKPCHVKIETHCLHTSLPSMELEYYSEDGRV